MDFGKPKLLKPNKKSRLKAYICSMLFLNRFFVIFLEKWQTRVEKREYVSESSTTILSNGYDFEKVYEGFFKNFDFWYEKG